MAQKRVRELAEDADNIDWGRHAEERMVERGIYDVDVLRILRKGHIEEPPEEGKNKGEWKCKSTLRLKGRREAGVVSIILLSGRLLITTVEWEDER